MVTGVSTAGGISVNAFADYEGQLRSALAEVGRSRPATGNDPAGFEPAFELPESTPELADYFSVANLRFSALGEAGGSSLTLLDMMGNPATRTVKTLASLVIVARAVRHIQVTGEPVMIVTPSSANKATALRDAVLRAHEFGLAGHDQLQIVSLVPDAARPKLWSSALSENPALAARNPVCVLDPAQPAHVKEIAKQALTESAADLFATRGIRLWHTMDLANYQCADVIRAFAEQDALPAVPGVSRAHVHSVSSAFGLLGHHSGRSMLPGDVPAPQYFLVQHQATSDMVRSLYGVASPAYDYDPATGLYSQDADPRFPATTFDPAENLEATFYTRNPATSPAMNRIIAEQGGGGVVVSLHECLGRYAEVRAMLAGADVRLPADPRAVREWSLVMALTGVLNAVERGLLDADEIVVHGSGSYSAADYVPVPDRSLHEVADVAGLAEVILEAGRSRVTALRVA